MAELRIHQEKVTPEIAGELIKLCPFSALSYDEASNQLDISSACKMCRMCVRKGPAGVMELVEETAPKGVDKASWKGIAVYADTSEGRIHPVTYELIGKAKELAAEVGFPVYAIVIADKTDAYVEALKYSGVDSIYVYDDPMFHYYAGTTYTNAFADFIQKVRPSSILVGATNVGRSLAPRVACRFKTGLTADCTALEIKENTDLVQIRPAFGGNIMARIITTNTRPQLATVRYKVFSAPKETSSTEANVFVEKIDPAWEDKRVAITGFEEKPRAMDLSEADIIVAVGRGLKSKDDLPKVQAFADLLGARLACSRPLVESNWLDASHQIGLSGKTVKPRLIITLGISGAIQFAAGMKSSDLIIAVNTDENAPIFDIAHYCVVADLYEVMDEMTKLIQG